MKVAILGAGLSGLSCAHRLMQHGVTPVIYEARHRVGERPVNVEAVVHVMHRPISDSLLHLSQRFGISLMPSSLLHTIRLHTMQSSSVLQGSLGYVTIRGNDERSLERQLAAMVAGCPIEFAVDISSEELARKNDFVVIATGDPTISMEVGIWHTDVEVFLKGAQVKGKFNPGVIDMWLDTDMARQGYVFQAAFDEHRAMVHIAAAPSGPDELDVLWKETVKRLKIEPVDDSYLIMEEYKIGRVSRQLVGNMIFVGNAAGYIDPFLGFGQIPSMLSGIAAADYIVGREPLVEPMRWFHANYEHCLRLREYMNKLTNSDFDRLVRLLNTATARPFLLGTGVNALALLARLASAHNVLVKV